MTIEFCGVSWLHPLSENLFSPQVRFCKASFFSEPFKYVTQFLSTLLANSAKYPNARSCAKFHSEFLFLTLNTLSAEFYTSNTRCQGIWRLYPGCAGFAWASGGFTWASGGFTWASGGFAWAPGGRLSSRPGSCLC